MANYCRAVTKSLRGTRDYLKYSFVKLGIVGLRIRSQNRIQNFLETLDPDPYIMNTDPHQVLFRALTRPDSCNLCTYIVLPLPVNGTSLNTDYRKTLAKT
jgi:hypothetical protein